MFSAITRISGLVNELGTVGVRVEVGDDFSRYRLYRIAQTDRDAMYPMFDVARSYIDASNGFWICGLGPNDEVVHTQAVRLLDLSAVTLRQHLTTHRHKYITPDTTPDPDLTYFSGPEALDRITGRVCYHGDFWLQPSGLGGMRSQGATSVFSRILFEILQLCWQPDYVFALVPQPLAAKGAHLRYGYSHCEAGKWVGPDDQTTDVDYMIWMSAGDIANALSREPQTLKGVDRVSSIRSALTAVDSKG